MQRTRSETIKKRIDAAIERIGLVSRDHYNDISVMSSYWASDDTGSIDDSSLFIETISKLETTETKVETRERVLAGDDVEVLWINDINDQVKSMTRPRRLFILHYAGHAVTLTCHTLEITSKISQGEIKSPNLSMTFVKEALTLMASRSPGLDFLLLLDCCCAAVAGRGGATAGERVELMAATSSGGLSNSRLDGETFTQHWCKAFNDLLELRQPFNCNDIQTSIGSRHGLEQYPATFVLREGWGVPITFRALPLSTTLTPTALTKKTVITALHIVEDPDSDALGTLIKYLDNAPVEITVIATIPTSSTLLLLRVPLYLQEMLLLLPLVLLF